MTDWKADSHTMIKRLVPPLALWITAKVLETRPVKSRLARVDSRAHDRVKRVTKNAKKNPAWLAASAAAFAVALGCIAKAGSSRKR